MSEVVRRAGDNRPHPRGRGRPLGPERTRSLPSVTASRRLPRQAERFQRRKSVHKGNAMRLLPASHTTRPAARLPRARRGAATVELAVLLPFLAFAFVVAVDFSRIFYCSLTVANCARNGALYGSADAQHALDTAKIALASRDDAGNLDPQQLSVSSATNSTSNPTYVDVTVSYPFSTITKYPGVPSSITIKRTVRMLVVPATPNVP